MRWISRKPDPTAAATPDTPVTTDVGRTLISAEPSTSTSFEQELSRLSPGSLALFANEGTDAASHLQFVQMAIALLGLVDTPVDRRALALEFRKLMSASEWDPTKLEHALHKGEFTAVQYFALGEIWAAGAQARLALGLSDEGSELFADSPVVHLSGPRLDLYLAGRDDLLGADQVFARIETHLDQCASCGAEADRRRAWRHAS